MTPTHERKHYVKFNQTGFTLVEALVAMAIFMLGFSGLFFFYSLSQHTIVEAEKRMYVNLMADRIVQTIAANSQLDISNAMNPFANLNCYKGDLNVCPSSRPVDEASCANLIQTWAYDLCSNKTIGPYNPTSGLEMRQIGIQNDGTGLIIDVSLVVANGSVSVFYTRKLRLL